MNHLLNNIQGFVMGGYAGNHRMGITDTDVAVGAASGITTASAILQFNKVAVAPATITMGAAAKGTTSVSFPEWSKVAASDVANDSAGDEGSDSPLVDLTSVANTVEVLRNSVAVGVTDLIAHGSSDAYLAQAGTVIGNAVAAEFDNHVMSNFDNFATSKGTDDSLRFIDIMDALASLEANDAPRPYSAVLHPQQMYGSYGLSNELSTTAVASSVGALAHGGAINVADQFYSAGFVTNVAGINFYTSPQVMDGSTGRKKGAIYAKTALVAGFIDFGGGNFIEVRTDRNELGAQTQLVANGYWAVAEGVDLHGVEIHTEIS